MPPPRPRTHRGSRAGPGALQPAVVAAILQRKLPEQRNLGRERRLITRIVAKGCKAEPNDEESVDIASSLLPPHYVKLKCNKPCGSLCGRKVEDPSLSLTQCECDPDEPEPCGPYSQCLNRFNICECPAPVSYDDLAIKPVMRSPLDKLGFPQKCCWCCSLKVASIFICILSFFWAIYEMITADDFMKRIFPDQGYLYLYCKVMYLLMDLFFILACGLLLLGIIIKRQEPIHIYIWYAFVFNCVTIVFIFAGAMVKIVRDGEVNKRDIFKTVFGIIWCCLFLYLLMVVNSYKLSVW